LGDNEAALIDIGTHLNAIVVQAPLATQLNVDGFWIGGGGGG